MYDVNIDFKSASKNFMVRPTLRGAINNESFTAEDILEGSFRCCNQCTDVSEVKVGGVFVGELRMTILSDFTRNRTDWVGSTVTFEYGLWVNDKFEYIPAPSGVYTIYEALWTEEGLEIVAYDNMAKFDKPFTPIYSRSTPYAWLSILCRSAGVELGTEELIIRDMCNGQAEVMIPTDYVVNSCRDLVSYLAALLGGFATIDRRGRLVIRNFKGRIVDTIKAKERFTGSKFSDYVTTFTGIRITSLIDGETKEFSVPPFTGLTMDLGANPFLQFGGNITANDMRQNILKALGLFAYRPFSVTTLGCCMYDLGDVITFSEGIAIGTDSCIMAYDFGLDSYSCAGYGANPALESAKNKYDKGMSSSNKASKSDIMAVVEVTNLDTVAINSEWKTIASVTFAVTSDQMIQFHGVVRTNLAERDNVQFKYIVNNIEQPFVHDENLSNVDTATLFQVFEAKANVYTNLLVMCKTYNTSGTVEPFDLHGALIGVGITKDTNDGNIYATDTFSLKANRKNKIAISERMYMIEPLDPNQIKCSDRFSLKANRKRIIQLIDGKPIPTVTDPIFRRITEDGQLRIIEDTVNKKMRITENMGVTK